jgi:hypothetical protein
MVLFNDDIIARLTKILSTLEKFKTTPNSEGKPRVHTYFQLPIDESSTPIYNPKERTEHIEIDKQIESLIGLFYAIDELYYPDDFTRNLNTQIDSKQYIPPFEELISLVSKYTHKNRDEFQLQVNSVQDRMYDNEIPSLLSKLEKLGLLGSLFRNAYNDTFRTQKYNLAVDLVGKPIPNVDLFSLGQCISQNENITAEAIKKIIKYENLSLPYHFYLVNFAIDAFLDKHNDNKQMLYKFIKYITGSVSLPSEIKINVINNKDIRIVAHTCSFSLEVGANNDVSTVEKLIEFIEVQISYDTGFSIRGGSRKTRSHKQRKSHKRNDKYNKNKISKRNRIMHKNRYTRKRR